MAKKKPKPKPRPPRGETAVLELPVAYSNVSIGEKTCRVGIHISRGNLTLAQADKFFCDKRLVGRILARRSGSASQESLPSMEDEDYELPGAFDVKGYSVSAKAFSCGLTFMKESIDVETLANFAKREGVFTVTETGTIPAESPATEDDEADGDE